MQVLAGNSNRPLAAAISAYLNIPLTAATIRRFSDMEVFVEIEENVRGEDVFLVQSTSYPANDNLMELLVCLDALKRGSARRVTAVIPYFGYARQDRKTGPRTPISAKLVANLITKAGADRVLTLDLHAGQIQGFFDIPTDNLFARDRSSSRTCAKAVRKAEQLVIVSPDVGGVVRARAIASRLDADLAIIDKRRPRAGVSEVMNIIGDVAGRRCILVDDIVDSSRHSLCNAAVALKAERGASRSISIRFTHGVLSGGAVARVAACPDGRARHHRQHPGDRSRAGREKHPPAIPIAPLASGSGSSRISMSRNQSQAYLTDSKTQVSPACRPRPTYLGQDQRSTRAPSAQALSESAAGRFGGGNGA